MAPHLGIVEDLATRDTVGPHIQGFTVRVRLEELRGIPEVGDNACLVLVVLLFYILQMWAY